ncbi:hypothetical protein DV515_00009072, partial [Chloebia gouldiae]
TVSGPRDWAWLPSCLIKYWSGKSSDQQDIQVKMEKNENVMAARAASPPSFSGLSSGFEACHWLVRKQKPTNQRNAQKAGMDHHQHAKGKDKDNKKI